MTESIDTNETADERPDSTFITRVVISNYKSIAGCDVRLGPLTFLVGPNGSGKSNFLDAIRFVADALRTTPEQALLERGGFLEVRRRTPNHDSLGIRLEFVLREEHTQGYYTIRIGSSSGGGWEVKSEEVDLFRPNGTFPYHLIQSLPGSQSTRLVAVDPGNHLFFRRIGRDLESNFAMPLPIADPQYLLLTRMAGTLTFTKVYERLIRSVFYNISATEMRLNRSPDQGLVLSRDGRNIGSVLRRMSREDPESLRLIVEYASHIIPNLTDVRTQKEGVSETIRFSQKFEHSRGVTHFMSRNMSDGSLRAVAVLTALFQSRDGVAGPVSLIGIEEPEESLHPAAAGVLWDALSEASDSVQVLVTSHSPELLDRKEANADNLISVELANGRSHIGPIGGEEKLALQRRLVSAGELLRISQIRGDKKIVTTSKQADNRLSGWNVA